LISPPLQLANTPSLFLLDIFSLSFIPLCYSAGLWFNALRRQDIFYSQALFPEMTRTVLSSQLVHCDTMAKALELVFGGEVKKNK
jgi:hypothetical protein